MKIKEVADLAGISIRTLHHYDEIGLLKPDTITESGYRLYSSKNLETLQKILFFKELGFSLKKIKEIIYSPAFDRNKALELQHKMLIEKRKRLNLMINTIEKTIRHSKGEIEMTNKEKFAGFDFNVNPYEKEARELWGDNAVDAANEKLAKLSSFEKKELSEKFNLLLTKISKLRHLPPDSQEALAAIHEWYIFINQFGSYSLEAFKNLGKMYVEDERFTKNIDRFGDGLAKFMCEAMAFYANKNA